jgi:hypothetical protein
MSDIRKIVDSKVEKEFDKFYEVALALDRHPGNALLYADLKGFDVTKASMKVNKMADAPLYPLLLWRTASLGRVIWFFEKKCANFRAEFGTQLDLMNLARALRPNTEYFGHIRLQKLNEFNRICLDQIRKKTELEYNIRSQFEN